jgi:signal transduction histidine kinase
MSWVLTGLFLSPLKKMTEIVSQFGKTDETILLHIKGSEEIEKLSEEFNLMTNRLEEYHQSSLGHMYENYENLKGGFDALSDPILLFDQNNDITFMNVAASRLFGISGSIKKKNPLSYFEKTLRESILKMVKTAFLLQKDNVPETEENPIVILRKKKKLVFVPYVYRIKNHKNTLGGVLILLQDLTRQSLSEQETKNIYKTFIHDFQAPLDEIQMALFATVQEKIGPLTEKQKEILYIARDKCEELEKLYQDFLKISEIKKKNL